MPHEIPSWITVTRGSAPLLLLAPHGGRRRDVRVPGKHKVNDLLTAELTHELAALCDASVIVNAGLDRNHLDLNRLSQVRRDAPWMVHLLAEMLGEMTATFGHATVLVIHGWNVAQVACDVGMGMRELADSVVPVRPDSATASATFVATRIRALQRAAGAADMAVTIGSRYPAAHPNNLLQIFRAGSEAESAESCPIAKLCRRATIEAAQLELGIPLRWPGPRRDRFVALLAECFGTESTTVAPRAATHIRSAPPTGGAAWRVSSGRVTQRRGVQFSAGEVLVMTSIDAGEDGAIAGRLIVSPDHDHLALFTGELVDASASWTVPPLTIASSATGGLRVVYEGPLVRYASLTPFLDLERGLAGSSLVEARVDLTVEPEGGTEGERFGRVSGHMMIDGRAYPIAARGVWTDGHTPKAPRLPSCRVTLPESPWGALVLDPDPDTIWTWDDGRLLGRLSAIGGETHGESIAAECDVRLAADAGTIALAIMFPERRAERLVGSLERLIPVRRPGREGTVVETTFALVRVDGAGLGWAEITVVKAISAAHA